MAKKQEKKKGGREGKPARRKDEASKAATTRKRVKPKSAVAASKAKTARIPAKPKKAVAANKAKTTRKQAKPENTVAPSNRINNRFAAAGLQTRTGLAAIAASVLLVATAGALLGPEPAAGAAQWVGRGLIQASYAALLVLFLWTVLGRRRGIAYLMLLGLACSGIAIWDTSAGIYANRLRLEANNVLVTFRDAPLDIVGLAAIIERNAYVEAYMVMWDVHWDLRNRLDGRMSDYRAAYGSYVENGQFLDVERLRSRVEIWRAFHQVNDLEDLLASIENDPVDTDDLLRSVNLLDVDRWTRDAYANDLKEAISAAHALQLEMIAREWQTLARIKQSLKVLIDAEGRYRFAGGQVVFEDPADAALFAGKEPASK